MVVGGLQAHSISHMGQVYSILRHKHVAWCCFGSKLLFCEGGTCVCAQSLQSCLTLCNPMDISPSGSSDHGDSPGKNTRVDCHAFLPGIFPTLGSNPGLLHCRQVLYHLSHQESPRILEWVTYPFSKGASQPRNRSRVSCVAGYQGSPYSGSPQG